METKSDSPPNISLVIPVYNEEESLPVLFEEVMAALEKLREPFEIIFIDDGSTDNSGAILRGFAEEDGRIKVATFVKNCGQSAAFAAGFQIAQGHVVVTMDADLQNDPRDIPLLLDKIESYDLVCGWRANRQDPWGKRVASRIANRSPFSIAIGMISSAEIVTRSPGITISVPSGSCAMPVTSVVRK